MGVSCAALVWMAPRGGTSVAHTAQRRDLHVHITEVTGKKYPRANHRFMLYDASFKAIAGIRREAKGNHQMGLRHADHGTDVSTRWLLLAASSAANPSGSDCRVAASAQVGYSCDMTRNSTCSYLRIWSDVLLVVSLNDSDQR